MIADHDLESLQTMVAAGESILRYVKGGKRKFLEDEMAQSAVERQFEVLGEAAGWISPAFRDASPEVPWRTLVALRVTLASGPVDPEKMWGAISKALTPTLAVLRQLQDER